MLRLPARHVGVGLAALLLAACSTPPAAVPTAVPPTTAPAAKPTTAPAPAPAPATSASPSAAGGDTLTLGGTTFRNHGTTDAKGKSDLAISAGDNYFESTFIQGTPGQKIKLTVKNTGSNPHNLSITSQNVNMDVAPGATITADVTLPSSGALLYFCRFHARGGMNGEFLVGDATPQPVSTAGTSAGAASSSTGTTSTTNAPNQGSSSNSGSGSSSSYDYGY